MRRALAVRAARSSSSLVSASRSHGDSRASQSAAAVHVFPIPATAREYERDGSSQFVLYWTQEGNRIWDEADEIAAQKETGFLTRPEWFDDALSGRMTQPTGRLVVLIGTGGNSPLDRREATEFARRLAEEIHIICPWAKP